MRVFWTILAITGSLVLLVLVGVAIAVWTIDVNQFVGPIQARVKDATGRDLAIGGGIDLKLGLQPKLVVNDVRVGNATWAKAPQMVTAKRVEAEVALLPLLQRRFELVRLNLVEPVIALETDAQGKGNWEFGTAAAGATAAPSRTAAALASFGVANVEINNGTLTYRDGASGSITHVAIDRLAAEARDSQSPINADFRGKVENVPVAVSGNFGSLDTLLQRLAPYPVSVQGDVNGQPAKVMTKVRVAEGAVAFDEIDLGLGASKAKGNANVTTGGPRPKLTLRLAWPTLALADLRFPRGTAPTVAKGAGAAKRPARLFDDETVSFAALRSLDVDGEISVGELKLPNGRRLDQVIARFTVKDGKLDAPELRAVAFGGTMAATLKIDATRAADPAIVLSLNAKGLDLAGLLAAAGMPRDVRGGKTDITIHVTTHGASPRQWASGANGNAQAVVGPATLVNVKLDVDSALNQLARAVNPLRDKAPSTELGCAVVRLPLRDGVARIDRTIAMETRELGVSASGTLDFRNETLDLAIMPRARVRLPIDVPQIADLVRFRGPFTAPAVTIDAAASAVTIAKIGAAISTGGLSAVGTALIAPAASGETGPCAVALGRAPPAAVAATASTSTARSPATPAEDLGKALGRLLGR